MLGLEESCKFFLQQFLLRGFLLLFSFLLLLLPLRLLPLAFLLRSLLWFPWSLLWFLLFLFPLLPLCLLRWFPLPSLRLQFLLWALLLALRLTRHFLLGSYLPSCPVPPLRVSSYFSLCSRYDPCWNGSALFSLLG